MFFFLLVVEAFEVLVDGDVADVELVGHLGEHRGRPHSVFVQADVENHEPNRILEAEQESLPFADLLLGQIAHPLETCQCFLQ